jgi:mRNA-degrading endonuclease RelE of RelBE toxin-antitoxin system
MIIEQTNHFKRTVKKMKKNNKLLLDEAVKEIINNPFLDTLKVGDFAGVRVYKYKVISSQYLLAYFYNETIKKIILLEIGFHENFYRDLKKQVKI